MRIDEVLDIVKQACSPNGYTKDDKNIKIDKKTNMSIEISSDDIRIVFDKENMPLVTYKGDFKFIKPSFSRYIEGVIFTDSEITISLHNFPDISLNYS